MATPVIAASVHTITDAAALPIALLLMLYPPLHPSNFANYL
jgi:hypothetical protein